MTFDFDNEYTIQESDLELDNNEVSLLGSNAKSNMFLLELYNAKTLLTQKTNMMSEVINNTKSDNQKLYDRCHVNSHAKTGGGGGFTNSYQKNC
tara:strand:+ start:702 stop:983 length:282 start_codon:yes stop_codon:yes gene_type:complete